MNRLVVMAHWDPRGLIGPHVKRQVEALLSAADVLTVVSTSALRPESRTWFCDRAQLIERPNYGYDFYSYKVGLDAHDLSRFDEVTVCNDTYVGPLVPYEHIYATMADRPVDFWGLTRSDRVAPHLQSFFVTFRPWVVRSSAFTDFWGTMAPISDRWTVIQKYEVGMSERLYDAGFISGAYYQESERERRLGRRRVAWWSGRRAPLPRSSFELGEWRRLSREPWNPAIALADVALDHGRLPFVKIDTLRYDPYGLDADRLLALCEASYESQFRGVRDWLAETAEFSPPRQREALEPLGVLRAARRWVRYGNGV